MPEPSKTADARVSVNIPPGITLATLRDGYPWRTHGSCQAFIEYSSADARWEWEVTHGSETGGQVGVATFLHRALIDLLNAEARLLREAFLRTPRNDYTIIPEPRLTMAETTRSALDAAIAGHGTLVGVSEIPAAQVDDYGGIPIAYDESVPPGQVRFTTGTATPNDLMASPNYQQYLTAYANVDRSTLEDLWRGAAWRDEMGRAAVATFERTLLNLAPTATTTTDLQPLYDNEPPF